MSSIIEFIMYNETAIMGSLFAVIIILLIVVLITDAINRKKEEEYKNNLFIDTNSNMIDAYSNKLQEVDNDYTVEITPIEESTVNENKTVSEIKYVEDDEELEKTKAQLELKNLKEELIKADLKEKEEKLKKQEEELQKEKEKIDREYIDIKENILDKIDSFEKSQEEKSIISLEEFDMLSDKIYNENEQTQYEDEGNEPISIEELEKLYNTKEIKTTEVLEKLESESNEKEQTPIVEPTPKYNEDNKFKTSPIISPVYGFDTTEKISQLELENTANLDKLNEEIRKTTEFLNALKELRKNLE